MTSLRRLGVLMTLLLRRVPTENGQLTNVILNEQVR